MDTKNSLDILDSGAFARYPPHQRLVAFDVEWMARMSVLGCPKTPEFVLTEELRDGEGPVLVHAMCSPGGNHLVTALCCFEERCVILRADGVGGVAHHLGIGRTKAENIGHQKTIIALALGKPTDARERGVELLLVGGARIKPDPHDQFLAEQRVDAM